MSSIKTLISCRKYLFPVSLKAFKIKFQFFYFQLKFNVDFFFSILDFRKQRKEIFLT